MKKLLFVAAILAVASAAPAMATCYTGCQSTGQFGAVVESGAAAWASGAKTYTQADNWGNIQYHATAPGLNIGTGASYGASAYGPNFSEVGGKAFIQGGWSVPNAWH